ncbi:hypothetical protein CRUP_019507, partial [Coryphaenoides rupestris]
HTGRTGAAVPTGAGAVEAGFLQEADPEGGGAAGGGGAGGGAVSSGAPQTPPGGAVSSGAPQTPPGGAVSSGAPQTPPGAGGISSGAPQTPPGGGAVSSGAPQTPPGGAVSSGAPQTPPGAGGISSGAPQTSPGGAVSSGAPQTPPGAGGISSGAPQTPPGCGGSAGADCARRQALEAHLHLGLEEDLRDAGGAAVQRGLLLLIGHVGMGTRLHQADDDGVQGQEVADGPVVLHDDVQWAVALAVHRVDVGAAVQQQLGDLGAGEAAHVVGVEVVHGCGGADGQVQQGGAFAGARLGLGSHLHARRAALDLQHAAAQHLLHGRRAQRLLQVHHLGEDLGEAQQVLVGCARAPSAPPCAGRHGRRGWPPAPGACDTRCGRRRPRWAAAEAAWGWGWRGRGGAPAWPVLPVVGERGAQKLQGLDAACGVAVGVLQEHLHHAGLAALRRHLQGGHAVAVHHHGGLPLDQRAHNVQVARLGGEMQRSGAAVGLGVGVSLALQQEAHHVAVALV